MSDLHSLIAFLKQDVTLAGFLGGLTRWATLRTDWREGLCQAVVGAICATYLADPTVKIIASSGVSVRDSTAGFIVGLGGVTIAGFMIDIVKAFRDRNRGGHPNA